MDCIDIKVGFACNNDCLHCVTADKRVFGDLTTEKLLTEIEHYSGHTQAVLVLTGGEPTIRPDLVDLVAFAHDTGFARIQLQTNARALADPKLADELARAGVDSALVALHGPSAEVHDAITRAPGGFVQTLAGMGNLLSNGVEVGTNTVISRLNLDHLEAMPELLATELPGIEGGHLTFPHANGNALKYFDQVVPPLGQTAEVVVRTLKRGLRGGIWFMVEAIPVCLLPGFEKHSLDITQLEVAGTDMGSGAQGGRVSDYRNVLRADKRKGEQCAQCSLTGICDGVWREYAESFGTDELRPVTDLDPAYVTA